MELNRGMMEELKRLSVLSAQLKDVEKLWAELYTNRRKAEECGAELNVLRRYSAQIADAANRMATIKNMIVEHVHLLSALYDATPQTESQVVQP